MCFEDDIFISYAHDDNRPLTEDQAGWISDFHRALEIRLTQLRGERPEIWRDPNLRGDDYFSNVIVRRLANVALLVSMLSPRYVRSEWCLKELREFCQAAERTGGVGIADKSRIFKVIKTPIDRDQHPQEMQGLLGYEFYQFNQDGHFREFNKIFGPDAEKKFWEKLEDLAQDIHQILKMIANNAVVPPGTAIYLAETTSDMGSERDKIKRELQQRGHIVIPDRPLPHYNPAFERVVRENLERCKLSIHLVGAQYGMVPEGADRSVVDLQNKLAVAYSQEHPGFSRLVWMPVGLQVQEENQEARKKQKALIESLQDDYNLLQTTLEELKTIVQDKIQDKLNPHQKTAKDVIKKDEPVRVYLICDQRDLEEVTPIYNYIFDWEEDVFEVMLPLFEGDEAQVRQEHQDSLLECDAVIIYYGNGNEQWQRTKWRDLEKIAGYGRLKPMLTKLDKAIYVAEPQTQQKQMFRTGEAEVIKNFGTFSPALLEPFLTQLARRHGGMH